jgi:hypothetical protein
VIVSVIVPYRPVDTHRARAWERVSCEWEGFDVRTADDGGEPFSRAASINLGVDGGRDAEVFVVADADILVDRRQVDAAVALAAHAPGLVIAFDRFAYLTKQGSDQIIDGYRGSWEPFIEWSLQDTVSSCVAFSRETWELSGGFDERFRAWGPEDVAFEVACATLAGPTRRIPGTAWHLFHAPEGTRPGHLRGYLDEYLRLRDDPDAMRAHIEAVRQAA